MSEILESLGGGARERIDTLRRDQRFFWVDLSTADTDRDQLGEVLGIAPHALDPLLDFSRVAAPSRKFHADGQHVVFPFTTFLELQQEPDEEVPRLEAMEVHVLVTGDYLLTLHREPASPPEVLGGYTPEGRSEQYVVYAVLDGMVATGFDALNDIQLALEGLQVVSTDIGNARVRMGTLRAISVRLSSMRRQIGPQQGIFERIS